MTRMTARQIAVQLLFSMEANSISAEDAFALFFDEEHYSSLKEEDELYKDFPDEEQTDYIRRVVQCTEDHMNEIDSAISRYSNDWRINRLSKSTLAILRCAFCEILYMEDIPVAASINEAVELGKRYDSPQAGSFINGLLGSFLRAERPESGEE